MLLHRQRQAGRGDGFSGGFLGGAGLVEGQEEGEDVGGLGHGVGGADGGIELGLGVAQGVAAGFFEGAVEIPQGPIQLRHHLAAQLAEGDGFFRHRFDLLAGWGLRPGEGVEDGVAGVTETFN